MKIGRNEPCHCGSGLKYKRCCAGKDEEARSAELQALAAEREAAAKVADSEGAQQPARSERGAPRTVGGQRSGPQAAPQRSMHQRKV
jgi:hypothetical protein